jgi:hypothetical protein
LPLIVTGPPTVIRWANAGRSTSVSAEFPIMRVRVPRAGARRPDPCGDLPARRKSRLAITRHPTPTG